LYDARSFSSFLIIHNQATGRTEARIPARMIFIRRNVRVSIHQMMSVCQSNAGRPRVSQSGQTGTKKLVLIPMQD